MQLAQLWEAQLVYMKLGSMTTLNPSATNELLDRIKSVAPELEIQDHYIVAGHPGQLNNRQPYLSFLYLTVIPNTQLSLIQQKLVQEFGQDDNIDFIPSATRKYNTEVQKSSFDIPIDEVASKFIQEVGIMEPAKINKSDSTITINYGRFLNNKWSLTVHINNNSIIVMDRDGNCGSYSTNKYKTAVTNTKKKLSWLKEKMGL